MHDGNIQANSPPKKKSQAGPKQTSLQDNLCLDFRPISYWDCEKKVI